MSYILVELIDDLHNFLKLLVRSVSVKRSKDKEIEINVNTKRKLNLMQLHSNKKKTIGNKNK